MVGLLVSVRSADEARTALAGGADLIDVKEPSLGSLGRADAAVCKEVLAAIGRRVPASIALGELNERADPGSGLVLDGFRYAKVGLAACGRQAGWVPRWEQSIRGLPASVIPVAVVYADWYTCGAPRPDQVIWHARALGCGVVLFDTSDKTQGDLACRLDSAQLQRLTQTVRRHGMQVVLGGSLDMVSIPSMLELQPDYIAVRGAACRGDRTNRVDRSCVQRIADLVHARA
jgi:uncharacterized protein (UPF0264 family)